MIFDRISISIYLLLQIRKKEKHTIIIRKKRLVVQQPLSNCKSRVGDVGAVEVEGDLDVVKTGVVVGEIGNVQLAAVKESALVALWAEVGRDTVYTIFYNLDSGVLHVQTVCGQAVGILEVDAGQQRVLDDYMRVRMRRVLVWACSIW